MTTNRLSNARFIRKDPGSGTEHCPCRIDVDGGSWVVGKVATEAEAAAMGALAAENHSPIGPGEQLVFVPNGVLEAS